jgi:hypothetical protein
VKHVIGKKRIVYLSDLGITNNGYIEFDYTTGSV